MRLSGKEAAPGPVEALKQMLFTMQDMAHHETLDNEDLGYYKVTLNHVTLDNEDLGYYKVTLHVNHATLNSEDLGYYKVTLYHATPDNEYLYLGRFTIR